MPLLHLESLPSRVGKGEVLKLLVETGGLSRRQVGRIELQAAAAAIEVPAGWQHRLAKALDGAELGGRAIRAWAEADGGAEAAGGDHFQRLLQLLEMEIHSEARQAAERAQRLTAGRPSRPGPVWSTCR